MEMNWKILISILLICCVLLIDGLRELTFTKEECLECCTNVSKETAEKHIKLEPHENKDAAYEVFKDDCKLSCNKKFSRSQLFRDFQSCSRGCTAILKVCREGCEQACRGIFRKWRKKEKPKEVKYAGIVPPGLVV